jgi:hypothetical protein
MKDRKSMERKQMQPRTPVAPMRPEPVKPQGTGNAEVDAMSKDELAAELRRLHEQRERQKAKQRERNRVKRESMTEEEKTAWRDKMKAYEVRKREKRAAMVERAKQLGLTS